MEKIKITNFRKIKETWDLQLAPITFFTGTNNSGKSTIFKALLLLEDYVNSNNHFELDFNGNNARKHKIDCYSNAINRLNRKDFQLNLSFEYTNKDHLVYLEFEPANIEDGKINKGILKLLRINKVDKSSSIIIERTAGKEYNLKVGNNFLSNRQKDLSKSKLIELKLAENLNNSLESYEKKLSELKLERNRLIHNIEKYKKEQDYKVQRKDLSNIRLNKVLSDLNISMDRAIEFLNSKGIQIAPRPTTRLSNEVYELLLYEFQKDGIAKIRSRELSVHKISDWIRNIDRESIELIQKIADGKEKLAILQRNIKEENKTSNQEIVFMPDFSLTDFNEEFLTIDAVISKVLPKYLVETPNKKFKSTDENIELQRAFVLGEKLIQILNFSIEHLSPNRNLQTRLYINNDTTSDINELIYEHSKTPIDKRSKAAKFLKYWMNEFDIGSDFRIKSFEGMASQIEIHFEDEWYNIVDKGFGAGQIFSILLKIALSINLKENELRTITKKLRRKGFDEFLLTHIMEEPEANLHPALQSKLADLFYEAYKEFDIKFILETHSEYILRKSQIHVKELNQQDDKLDKLPFGVFYFDKESGPYKMEYRKDGKFINEFGSGFFDVSTNLAFDIL